MEQLIVMDLLKMGSVMDLLKYRLLERRFDQKYMMVSKYGVLHKMVLQKSHLLEVMYGNLKLYSD